MSVVKLFFLFVVMAFVAVLGVLSLGQMEGNYAASNVVLNETLGTGAGSFYTDFAPLRVDNESVGNNSNNDVLVRNADYTVNAVNGLVVVNNSNASGIMTINYTWITVDSVANAQLVSLVPVMFTGLNLFSVLFLGVVAFAILAVLVVVAGKRR